MWIYLLGIIQEYFVILNVYNADLIPDISSEFQYCIPDLIILIYLFFYYHKKILLDLILVFICFISHLQWYFHSPFTKWPDWWPYTKSANDIRHRTEYYDTHVMCFLIYFVLFIRFLDKRNRLENY